MWLRALRLSPCEHQLQAARVQCPAKGGPAQAPWLLEPPLGPRATAGIAYQKEADEFILPSLPNMLISSTKGIGKR